MVKRRPEDTRERRASPSVLFIFFLLVKFALAARARFDVSGGRRRAARVRRLLMLGGLRAEEMQAEGCQREIKALQCTVHKLFSFSLLVLCSGLQAAAADPLLPPRLPSDTLLVPIHGASNVCANHGRVRSRLAGGGWGVGRACVRCSFFIP